MMCVTTGQRTSMDEPNLLRTLNTLIDDVNIK